MTTTKFQQGRRRKMTKFIIGELSAVDTPAQEGAQVVILKRRDDVKSHDPRARLRALIGRDVS